MAADGRWQVCIIAVAVASVLHCCCCARWQVCIIAVAVAGAHYCFLLWQVAGGRWQFVAGAGGRWQVCIIAFAVAGGLFVVVAVAGDRWQQMVDGRCASLLLLWQVRFIVVAVAVAFYSVV